MDWVGTSNLATERRSTGSRTSDHPLTALLANHADHCVVGPLTDEEIIAVIPEWFGPSEPGSVRRRGTPSWTIIPPQTP